MGAGYSTVTPPPSQVSATSVAQAVWSYTPRSLTDIQSLVSAIQNNDPSLLSTLSDILYVPAPYFAGQVSATQVAAFLDNLVLNYGLAGPVAAAIAASPYGLWSTNFVTQILPYLSTTSVAQILYSGQMDANHVQLILYWLAQNYYYNKWVYTVTANATSITFSTNTVLNQNVLIAQNITIASGVTVTCGTTTCFFIAQAFNNYGTIANKLGAPGGVPATSENGNYGGTGGGGIAVIAITAALGTLNMSGNPGNKAYDYDSGAGGAGGAGVFHVVTGVTVSIGGTGGGVSTGYMVGISSYNGGGGGGSTSYAGGAGGNATVNVFSSPNAMVTYILQGLSDWWLINVLGKAPSPTTPLAYMYGSGGGAGGATSGYQAGGAGGGGAGEVVVYGYNIVSGNITAVGGTGGGGFACVGCVSVGGGGGGGGLVFIFYGATSGTVTAGLAGGAGGAGNTSPANGLPGSTGVLYIAAVTVNG